MDLRAGPVNHGRGPGKRNSSVGTQSGGGKWQRARQKGHTHFLRGERVGEKKNRLVILAEETSPKQRI